MTKEMKEIIEELESIESRSLEIRSAVESAEGEELESLDNESRSMMERKAELEAMKAEIEEREEEARKIAEGMSNAKPVVEPEKEEETRMFTRDSKEYRDLFHKAIRGMELTAEERAVITTESGIAVPTEVEKKIWDNVHTAHPILDKIETLPCGGGIFKYTKHKAITAGKAAKHTQGAAITEETNTFETVTLTTEAYAKTVAVAREMILSDDQLEAYIVAEASADIGEALAAEAVATLNAIVGGATQAAAGAVPTYKELMDAMGKTKNVANMSIVCNNAMKYALAGMVDTTGQPIMREGVAMGAEVVVEEAATNFLFVGDLGKLRMVNFGDLEVLSGVNRSKLVNEYTAACYADFGTTDDRAFCKITLG